MWSLIEQIDDNPYVLAMAIILSNVGFNYILDDLSEHHKKLLNNSILRKIYLFALIYCGTQNLTISTLATVVYIIIVHFILPEIKKDKHHHRFS
ncbi:MAG: hypothetical protein WD512_20965 [Candidatus Paceibacterota bacterium]